MKFATKVIHAGIEPDSATGAIMTPIYQTSTYVQEALGIHKGYEYARTQNPTRMVLEKNIAALENGKYGISFSSGMAACDAVIKLLQPDDEVIATNDIYGGSYRMFTKIFADYGIPFHFIDMIQLINIENAINENTKMLWIETPTNPLLNIVDIKGAVSIAKKHNILICVDNTFASPYLQNPLDLGADIVVHSATKYLGGHSDVVLGAAIVNDDALSEKLYFIQNTCGAVPGPHDCWLVLRGLKTLHLRMERHCENAEKIAHFLKEHSKVERLYWPGFESHPNHAVAKKQMSGFGGMVSFSLKGNKLEDASKVMTGTKIFSLAESLGGVESLIGHPATMTHAAIPKQEREKIGVVNSLIRLSVGIEDAQDLIADLQQAMGKI